MFCGFRPELGAVFMAIGLLGCEVDSAITEKIGSDSSAAVENSDFLYPEAGMLRGCSPPSLPHKQQPSHAYTGEASGHYCVADFNGAEKWETNARGIESQLSYLHDAERNSEVLAVRFGRADKGVSKVEFRMVPDALQKVRFERVDSVRIWVKGNGSSAGLRVWLLDRDGEKYTPQKALRLNFNTWAFEDLSFAPGLYT